jgi:hypothetical protein
MIFPMSRWPGRSVTGQASGAFAALPATRRRPSAPLPAPACRAGARRDLFAAIARDLEAKGATVRKGTSPQSLTAIASLIDATIIGSASTGDKEAAWGTARARPRMAHIAAAKDSGIICDIETTPANEPDVAITPSIIPDKPEFMPTKPMMRFRSKRRLKPRVEPQAFAQGPSLAVGRKARSAQPSAAAHSCLGRRALDKFLLYRFGEGICLETPCSLARIEKIFGTWKRSLPFAVIAYNVKRHWRLQSA